MLLRHHAETGLLVRDHALNRLNRLNVVANGLVFTRAFSDRSPDARARVASRYENRGYEYFDFASPPGHQIDSVTLRAKVDGIAGFSFNLPKPAGWPPRFSFSKRIENLKFSKAGDYKRSVALPPGTEFFSIGTSWGSGLYSNSPAEVLYHRRFGPKDGPDIVRWEVSFVVSPRRKLAARPKAGAGAPLDPAVRKLIDRHAAGWDSASVVRGGQATAYAGDPPLDVYAEDWFVYSLHRGIQIFQHRAPLLT
ncbi:MAG: hypothetical protein GY953_28385, partial [bacterium]|nr:hypothetical protein [bacterium]